MSQELIEIGQYNYLLFDGDCGICTYSSELAKKIDARKLFRVVPYQQFPEKQLQRYRLSHEQCASKVQVISRRGRVYSGAFGINYFLFSYFPWSLLVILIYAMPVLLLLELVGYALVAKYRHRLSRWLGLKACLTKQRSDQ
jgi:predicted DCC family thiol-disulfide oxidoreductase YuxK